MYVNIVITCSKGKDQPGKVANPARGHLTMQIPDRSLPIGFYTVWYGSNLTIHSNRGIQYPIWSASENGIH